MNVIRISVLALFLLILTGCGGGGGSATGSGEAATGTGTTPLKRLIVVIGDSIGTGFGASIAFPDLIQSQTGISVVNVSKGGSSAEFGASRALDLINQFRPMYLVVLLGTNNAEEGVGGGVSGAISSLQFIANVANSEGVIPVIGTIPPIPRSARENSNASAISAGIRGIGSARIALINSAFSRSDIGPDNKHPNNSGQQIIANLFVQQIN